MVTPVKNQGMWVVSLHCHVLLCPTIPSPLFTLDCSHCSVLTRPLSFLYPTLPYPNQPCIGQCGSCWAHSVTEQIESEWMLAGNAMWEFSVQQVNSCVRKCFGCGGGDTPAGYEYVCYRQCGLPSCLPCHGLSCPIHSPPW